MRQGSRLFRLLGGAAAAAFAVFLVSAPHGASAKGGTEDFSWSGQVDEGHTLSINNVNGSVTLLPSDGRSLEVAAVKKGRRSDPTSVHIEVQQDGGNVTICSLYPGWGNHCNGDGTMTSNVHNNDVNVTYTIRVPNGLRLRVHTVNGGIESTAHTADVEMKTVNGHLSFSTSGRAEGKTVNGSIQAVVSGPKLAGDVDLESVNGRIGLSLPRQPDADVETSAVHGAIDIGFPLGGAMHAGERRIEGRLGSGGHQIQCKTVNGGITIGPRDA